MRTTVDVGEVGGHHAATLVDAAWTSKPRSAVNTGNRNGS
jgi:hypothetical protein